MRSAVIIYYIPIYFFKIMGDAGCAPRLQGHANLRSARVVDCEPGVVEGLGVPGLLLPRAKARSCRIPAQRVVEASRHQAHDPVRARFAT
jgi:hypothetical protein